MSVKRGDVILAFVANVGQSGGKVRVLSPGDIDTLLARLRDLEGDRWTRWLALLMSSPGKMHRID